MLGHGCLVQHQILRSICLVQWVWLCCCAPAGTSVQGTRPGASLPTLATRRPLHGDRELDQLKTHPPTRDGFIDRALPCKLQVPLLPRPFASSSSAHPSSNGTSSGDRASTSTILHCLRTSRVLLSISPGPFLLNVIFIHIRHGQVKRRQWPHRRRQPRRESQEEYGVRGQLPRTHGRNGSYCGIPPGSCLAI